MDNKTIVERLVDVFDRPSRLRFPDSKRGAAAVASASGDYGVFQPEACQYILDAHVDGVWAIYDVERDFGLIVNVKTEAVVNELSEFDWQKLLLKHGGETFAGEVVYRRLLHLEHPG